ncbi:MAG: tRNA (adenosine(37)-N6)-dimethylallyltransferase MiaA [Rhodomicrobiaceae bacterium]
MTGSQPKFRFTLIAGPTASGKSALAAHIAREHGGIVVNADSMQVYKDLRLLTARPSEEEEAAVPHRLYGFRAAEAPYSVAAWLADLEPLVAEARAGGPPLVITGGTGLYFKALLEGLSPVPEIPEDIRRFWRAEAVDKGSAALHGVLQARDPAMAERLPPSDPQRIVRALEVLDASGKSLREWQASAGTPLIDANEADRIHVCPLRETLYARCDARLDRMVENGAVDEVRRLQVRGLDPSLPVMRALGVRSFLAYLDGLFDWEAALVDAKTETRRYAKRQMTWARRNMMSWNTIFE